MLYVIAAIMGYVITCNVRMSRAAQYDIGAMLVDPTARRLLSLGGAIGGWFCILPAAYFTASAEGNGFFEGFLFVVASLAGGFLTSVLRVPGLTQLLAILTVFINVGLAALVFYLTRQ